MRTVCFGGVRARRPGEAARPSPRNTSHRNQGQCRQWWFGCPQVCAQGEDHKNNSCNSHDSYHARGSENMWSHKSVPCVGTGWAGASAEALFSIKVALCLEDAPEKQIGIRAHLCRLPRVYVLPCLGAPSPNSCHVAPSFTNYERLVLLTPSHALSLCLLLAVFYARKLLKL